MSDSNTSITFQDEALTEVSHQDPDKHWIGEALPAPSQSEVEKSGTVSGVGESPFPARADHTHDTTTIWSQMGGNNQTYVVSGSAVFYNQLIQIGGADWRDASLPAQKINFPMLGLYHIRANVTVTRSTGNFVSGDYFSVLFAYNNATAVRTMMTIGGTLGRGATRVNVTDILVANTGADLQFQFINGSAVDVTIAIIALQLTRIGNISQGA